MINEDEARLIQTQREFMATVATDLLLEELARRSDKLVVIDYRKRDQHEVASTLMVKVSSLFELEGILQQAVRQVQLDMMRRIGHPSYRELKGGSDG
jgi:hypothetical protein